MRELQIPGFPGRRINITELESLTKGRLLQDIVIWPNQAVTLVGYMAWPNDEDARNRWIDAYKRNDASELRTLLRKLKIIQQHWARIGDIIQSHYNLTQGRHQLTRAGASVGKAIELIDANARSKGTGRAKLWEIWAAYRDVAHLVTAAVLISADVQIRHRAAPYGLKLHQFQPYRMAMLLPELVIAIARTIEKYGLQHVPHGRTEPLFDRKLFWRIPKNIKVAAIPLPVRRLTRTDVEVLNARRAGNRGKAKRRRTTPVFA
jgi:hypothetical protein